MAKRPKNKKIVPAKNMLPSPLFTTIKAAANALDRRKSKKYVKSLKKMGMFEEGGGRANVPPKGEKYKPKQKPKSDTEKLMDESRKKYGKRMRNISPEAEKRLEKKKTPPKNTRVYKTAKGGRIDGAAIRGKTKGVIR